MKNIDLTKLKKGNKIRIVYYDDVNSNKKVSKIGVFEKIFEDNKIYYLYISNPKKDFACRVDLIEEIILLD